MIVLVSSVMALGEAGVLVLLLPFATRPSSFARQLIIYTYSFAKTNSALTGA